MPEFDIGAFVATLERMGLRLTAVPLADGRLRVNRWRMPDAAENAKQIQDLWSAQIGDDQGRMDLLAAHLAPAPRIASATTSWVRPARFPASDRKIQAKNLR
jgi:hypothetical protein